MAIAEPAQRAAENGAIEAANFLKRSQGR